MKEKTEKEKEKIEGERKEEERGDIGRKNESEPSV
jgi:hypothetical protein